MKACPRLRKNRHLEQRPLETLMKNPETAQFFPTTTGVYPGIECAAGPDRHHGLHAMMPRPLW